MNKEKKIKLSSNMEDYIEVIAILNKENKVARVKDISRLMHVKNPSVTGALRTLEKNNLVRHEPYGYVELTSLGENIAQDIQKKHHTLLRFLTIVLKIDPVIAERDACNLEHSISALTLEKLTKFLEFVKTCPENETPEWLVHFHQWMRTGKRDECSKKKLNK
jgi:DtxR family Mn-dependent transcriptional regulator